MKYRITTLAAALAVALAPATGSAAVLGFLGNFDVVNDTGKTAHGFEIDLEGVHASDITDTFGGAGRGFPSTVERYGAPVITDTATGARVVYEAQFTAGTWGAGTPDISTKPTFTTGGESCWTGGLLGYGAATPCDHFGVGTRVTPNKTVYSWLTESNTPGVLTNGVVNLPAPVFIVTPPPPPPAGQPPAPPVVAVQVVAPVLPELNALWGTPVWAKVVTTTMELNAPVGLEELVGNGPKVPMAKSEMETEWHLLQMDPGNPNAVGNELNLGGNGPVGKHAESVVRRIEFFKYAGSLSAEGEATPINGDSATPAAGDLGTFIGDQNVGVNLGVAAVPEPETYALMLGGLAVAGFVARRRQA